MSLHEVLGRMCPNESMNFIGPYWLPPATGYLIGVPDDTRGLLAWKTCNGGTDWEELGAEEPVGDLVRLLWLWAPHPALS